MKITKIKVNSLLPKEQGICGEFTITFDNALVVRRIYVINGKNGLFVTFPNDGTSHIVNGVKRYTDLVFPTSQTFRQYIVDEVLSAYREEVEKFQAITSDSGV